eukprot:1604064-Prymnesium_polylepis.1
MGICIAVAAPLMRTASARAPRGIDWVEKRGPRVRLPAWFVFAIDSFCIAWKGGRGNFSGPT